MDTLKRLTLKVYNKDENDTCSAQADIRQIGKTLLAFFFVSTRCKVKFCKPYRYAQRNGQINLIILSPFSGNQPPAQPTVSIQSSHGFAGFGSATTQPGFRFGSVSTPGFGTTVGSPAVSRYTGEGLASNPAGCFFIILISAYYVI